jgi:hypothetical protein
VIDAKTMKITATYPLGDNGGCNGLALDVKNQILFAACSAVGPAPARGTPDSDAACTAANSRSQRQTAADVRHPGCEGRQDPGEAAARRQFRRRGVQPGDAGSVQHAGQRHDDHRQGEEPDEFRGRAGPEDLAVERRAHDRLRQQDGTPLRDGVGARAASASPPAGTPPPAGGRGGGRAPAIPGSFTIIMVGPK